MNTIKNTLGPVAKEIQTKLTSSYSPVHLEVLNESYMHAVPKGSETHFKVVVISEQFKGMKLIDKHRSIQQCLKEELQTGVHALSIVAKTQDEWNKNPTVEKSPNCMGGSKQKKVE